MKVTPFYNLLAFQLVRVSAVDANLPSDSCLTGDTIYGINKLVYLK